MVRVDWDGTGDSILSVQHLNPISNIWYPFWYKLILGGHSYYCTRVVRLLAASCVQLHGSIGKETLSGHYWDIVRNIWLYRNIESWTMEEERAPTYHATCPLDIGHRKPLSRPCIELGIALEFSDISVINLWIRMEFIDRETKHQVQLYKLDFGAV